MPMRVSLIVTVKNEAPTMRAFLDSVAAQTRQPDEMVVVDGGSSDATPAIVQGYPGLPIRFEHYPGNIASGRNRAISLATGEFIAVTDAGCVLDAHWLERITSLADECGEADVVVGGYAAVVESLFDACQYSLHNLFRSDASISSFAISSRSIAFRKEVWQELGGYPEWLDFSEDTYFHNAIRDSRFRMRMERGAVVYWRLRPGYRAIFRQFYRYMRGDGMARQHTLRHLLRLAAYGAGFALLGLSVAHPVFLLPFLLGVGLYMTQPIRNFRRLNRYPLDARALGMLYALLLVMDAGKICGYLAGLAARPAKPAGPAGCGGAGRKT